MYLSKCKIVIIVLVILVLGSHLLCAQTTAKELGLSCDGTNGFITAKLAAPLAEDLSLEIWINTTLSTDSYQERVVAIGNGTDNLQICINSGRVVIDNSGGPKNGLVSPGLVNDGIWHQVVVVRYEKTTYALYVDGKQVGDCTGTTPIYNSVFIGYSPTQPAFHGVIDDVRVYNRTITQMEVMNNYTQNKPGVSDETIVDSALGLPEKVKSNAIGKIIRDGLVSWWKLDGNANDAVSGNNGVISGNAAWVPGRGEAIFTKSRIETSYYNIPAKLRIEIDSRQMGALSKDAEWHIMLCSTKGKVVKQLTKTIPSSGCGMVSMPVEDIKAGNYEIRVQVVSEKKQTGEISSNKVVITSRPEWAKKSKICNNLVSEFINEKGKISGKRSFYNPRNGWVFFSVIRTNNASSELNLNSMKDKQILLTGNKWKNNKNEAMRFLSAGDYTLTINGDKGFTNLIVRSIPELQFCEFLDVPSIKPYGIYDIEYMKKTGILENINTIQSEGNSEATADPFYKQWQENGGRWIYGVSIGDTSNPEKVYKSWTHPLRAAQPFADGLIIDEFMQYKPERTEAIRLLFEDKIMTGKYFYPYVCSPLPNRGGEEGVKFLRMVMEHEGPIAWERYLQEQPNENDGWAMIDMSINQQLKDYWLKPMPDSVSHILLVLGNFLSAIPMSLNVCPDVDFKVWMDMQYNILANDPMFYGLYGLSEWQSHYADEEYMRWEAKLYRHYAIEGKTEMLSPSYGFKYKLTHILNPDFADGLSSWTTKSAVSDSIQTKNYKEYSYLQGRYPITSQGDTFLWTKRSSVQPNIVSQTIKNLVPGKLYSLKIFTSDYQDLVTGKSEDKMHAISININGAQLIPDKSFQDIQKSKMTVGLFGGTNQLRTNFHRRIFRAQSKEATLSISDWQDDKTPGGPVGQELIYNFIELQPYLEN